MTHILYAIWQERTFPVCTLRLFVCMFVYLLTAPYQAPHLVHCCKMLVLDFAVFRLPGVLYGWILQSDLTLPCDLEWPLAGR